jgi:hypothetical protein
MWHRTFKYWRTSLTIGSLNGQLMSSLLIFKCPMSHGIMKYTLKAHVCYFVLMVEFLHYLYSLHANFYTSENIINIVIRDLMGNFFNNEPKFLKLTVNIYNISIYRPNNLSVWQKKYVQIIKRKYKMTNINTKETDY